MSATDQVRAAFHGAEGYDAHARVQRVAALGLADRVAALPLPAGPRVLEIGCGTGFLTEALMSRIGGEWIVSDVAPGMIERCRARIGMAAAEADFRVVDGEAPDPALGRFDLICSSFTFQWFGDLDRALGRLRGMLAPGGRLAFAMPAAGSLAEWHAAHRAASGRSAAMADYPDPALFADAAVEEERVVENFLDGRAFLAALRGIGAHRPRDAHRPLSAPELRRAIAAFEAGGATVSWRIAYVILPRDPATARAAA